MARTLNANLASLQSAVLKVLARSPRAPKRIPLFYPPVTLHTNGGWVAGIFDSVFCRRQYEPPIPMPARPTIVDAGAHAGLASMFFLSEYPGSRVVAFEPNPNLAPLVRKNVEPWKERATVHEAALSTASGEATFHLTADNPLNVTGGLENREAPERNVQSFSVACLDARQVLPEHIDYMKLDVEGHEYPLLSMDLFTPQRVASMAIEFHDIRQQPARFRDTVQILSERGYRFADEDNQSLSKDEVLGLKDDSVVLKLF